MPRQLTSAERDRLAQLHCHGSQPKEIVEALRALPVDRQSRAVPQPDRRRILRRASPTPVRAAATRAFPHAQNGRPRDQPCRPRGTGAELGAGADRGPHAAAARYFVAPCFAANDLRLDQAGPSPHALGIAAAVSAANGPAGGTTRPPRAMRRAARIGPKSSSSGCG